MAPDWRRTLRLPSVLLVLALVVGAVVLTQHRAASVTAPSPGAKPPAGPGHGGPHSPVSWTPESLPYSGHVTTSYGFSVLDKLKYPPGFKHFDFVNPDAPKGGTFRGTSAGGFDSLNGFIVLGSPPLTFRLSAPPTETLMMRPFDEQNSQYGLLAESVTWPDDYSWVEYKLRPEARWHDGQPVTVRDVLFTVDFLMTKGTPIFRARYPSLAKLVQTGPRSVRFVFSDKNNRAAVLNAGDTPVLAEHYYRTHDLTKPSLAPTLGSGPYRFTKVDPGRSLTLERVKDYWGRNLSVNVGRNNFDVERFDFYRDRSAEFEAFMAGAADFRTLDVPPTWVTGYDRPAVRQGLIKKDPIVLEIPGGYRALYFNLRRDKFKDPRVREALSYALDFGFVNRVLFYGLYNRIRTYFPNSVYQAKGAPTPEELKLLEPFRGQLDPRVFTDEYHPATLDGGWASRRAGLLRAQSLLEQAGYQVRAGRLTNVKTGEPLRIEILMQDPSELNVMGVVTTNLRRLGIDARVRMMDSTVYSKRIQQLDFDLTPGAALGPQLAPGAEMRGYYQSKGADRRATANWMGIKSPVVDALLEKLITDTDMNRKLAEGRALDRVLTWGFYSIPLYRMATYNIAYWDKFGRPKYEPGATYIGAPSNWWVDPKKEAALKARRGS